MTIPNFKHLLDVYQKNLGIELTSAHDIASVVFPNESGGVILLQQKGATVDGVSYPDQTVAIVQDEEVYEQFSKQCIEYFEEKE